MELLGLRPITLVRALDRTLVLPLFCIYKSVPGVYEGSPDWCTIEVINHPLNPKP
jgi:hypothetical protein